MRALPLLVLLLLLAPLAAAQTSAGERALRMAADPAEGWATPGESLRVRVGFASMLDHDVLLDLASASRIGVRIAYDPPQVLVPAGGTARTLATIHVPHDAPVGTTEVALQAEAVRPRSDGPILRAQAVFTLHVPSPPDAPGAMPQDPAPTPPAEEAAREPETEPTPETQPPSAPLLRPRALNLTAARDGRASATFQVGNPDGEPRTYGWRLLLPEGWKGALEPAVVELPPGGTRTVTLTIHAGAQAQDARGQLFAGAGGVEAALDLRLRVLPLAAAGGEGPEGPLAPALPRPIPPPARLRVEPEILEVPPGGGTLGWLLIENPTRIALEAEPHVRVADGFTVEVLEGSRSVPPGGQARVAFMVRDAAGASADTLHEGSAGLRGVAAEPAPFKVRLLEAAPPAGTDAAQPREAASSTEAALLAAAVASVGAASLAGAWANRRWALPLAALYTRLRPNRLLDHPVRARMAKLVEEEPGITFSDLARRLDVAAGMVTHHARILERAHVVRSVQDGQNRRFHPLSAGRVERVPPLGERTVALLSRGPASAAELAKELGVSRQALHYHVKRLTREGRLVPLPDGRVALRASPDAAARGP